MKVGIITDGRRPQYLSPLLSMLGKGGHCVKVFHDPLRRGFCWNSIRAMRDVVSNAETDEPTMLCNDDIVLVSDWEERWSDIHAKAKVSTYCLFSRQKNLFTASNIAQGFAVGCFPRGLYDLAVVRVNQQELLDDVIRWYEANLSYRGFVNRETAVKTDVMKHSVDIVIQEYYLAKGIPWAVTVPTLADHVGEVSTLKHSIGRSPMYLGNTKEGG